jgi:hypothetical protein
MKFSPTLTVLLIACALFVLSPYIPSWILNLTTGTMVGALLLMVLVLFVLQGDIVLGLATFLAVAALFLEQRRRTVLKVTTALGPDKVPFKVEQLEQKAPDLVPGEVHPDFKGSEVEDHGFEPGDDIGKNTFERVDESQDDKQPLDTVPPNSSEVSEFLQEKGLASI